MSVNGNGLQLSTEVTVLPRTKEEAEYLVNVFYLIPPDEETTSCSLCLNVDKVRDARLLLESPEAVSLDLGLVIIEAEAHRSHLTQASKYFSYIEERKGSKLSSAQLPTIDKLHWVQNHLFQTLLALLNITGYRKTRDIQSFFKMRVELLKEILHSVKIESDITGAGEIARQKARFQAEKAALEDEDLMSEEDKLRMAKAMLRSKGYMITKNLETVEEQ